MNRLVSQTDALGVRHASEYDHVGNLLVQTRAAGTMDERSTRYEYDLDNRLTRSIDPEARTGLRIRRGGQPAAPGRRPRPRHALRLRRARPPHQDHRPAGLRDPHEYDGVGNRLALIDARGGLTRFDYDPGNRLHGQTTDAEGRVTRFELRRARQPHHPAQRRRHARGAAHPLRVRRAEQAARGGGRRRRTPAERLRPRLQPRERHRRQRPHDALRVRRAQPPDPA